MVYVEAEDEPHRMPVCVPAGCAPLYRMPQTKWTWRLTVEMTIYVTWILGSMVLGGLMPTLLHKPAKSVTGAWDVSRLGLPPSNLSFCPAKPNYNYAPPARGFPPPPLRTNGSEFIDGWEGQRVQLRGASWFGFNNEGGMVDALWVGGSRADTDFHALVYQMRLLGFNSVRLPFTFAQLKNPGKGQVMQCSVAARDAWVKRTVDPDQPQAPNTSAVPEEAVPLELQRWEKELCNTYVPSNDTTLSGERLLWTMQYFVASGFYVVLDYHPSALDPLPGDADAFARAWAETWSSIACLPNYASDLKGRLLLDLLNEPDAALEGRGIHWQTAGTTPGLDLLYLSAIDAIEDLTPGDALYMVQGSTAAESEATPGGPRTVNAFGLTAGDGFVSDGDAIQKAGLSDPRPFFTKLLGRPAAARTVLAPHVFPPEISSTKLNGTTPAGGKELFEKLAASWGGLARSGFCSKGTCHRFPVVIGEMGSKLESKEDAAFFTDLALFVTASGDLSDRTAPIAGWFWWSFNPNSALTGGLIAPNGTAFSWTKLRLLVSGFGLRPWYLDPPAFSNAEAKARAESQKRREATDKEVVAAAAAAGRGPIAAAPPAQERRPPPDRRRPARRSSSRGRRLLCRHPRKTTLFTSRPRAPSSRCPPGARRRRSSWGFRCSSRRRQRAATKGRLPPHLQSW